MQERRVVVQAVLCGGGEAGVTAAASASLLLWILPLLHCWMNLRRKVQWFPS